jgi:prepilin-type N-terminal cleavage/methylation domain-containing protein
MTDRISTIPKQAGFTLVEVMLALTLFALLTTILYAAISLGHAAVEKTQASFDKSQKLRSAVDLLGSYIRSSYPYRLLPQDPTVFYTGEEAELTFVSAVSLTMGGRGLAKIHLSWDGENDGAGTLRVEEQVPLRVSDDSGGGYTNEIVLADQVAAFRLTYLNPQSEKEDWVERWDPAERKTLPRAVRLNFRLEGKREVEWVFPIMMNVLAP